MNNNRNNRRRGRGNRNQGGGQSVNRIDSRARGNAPQLLDKYKKLAQDAQHNGDRVQAEYYLQFADHYFRVIADNKARLDEARGGRRDDERQADDDEDEAPYAGRAPRRDDDQGAARGRTPSYRERDDEEDDGSDGDDLAADRARPSRPRRGANGNGNGYDHQNGRADETPRRRQPGRPPRRVEGEAGIEGEIDAAALPPAIGADDTAPAPRRRRRKVSEGEDASVAG